MSEPASRRPLLLAAAVLIWIYVYGIAANPPKWEEPRRSLVAMEMIHRGDYVVPRILGEPYLKKPPLQNWLAILLAGNRLPRVNAVVLRSISLLAICGTCLLLWRMGLTGLPGRRAGPRWLAPAVFLTTATIIQSGRAGEIDPLFCFTVTAAFACFELGRREDAPWLQWYVSQLFVALGVLTKILAPLFFYPPVLWMLWRHRDAVRLRVVPFALGLVSSVLVVSAWLVPYSTLNPSSGIGDRWVMEVLARTVQKGWFVVAEHLATYPLMLFLWFLPWSIIVLLLLLRREGRNAAARLVREDPLLALCQALVVWGIVVFLFVPEQKARYLIPVVPMFSVLVARFLAERTSLAHLGRLRGFGTVVEMSRRRIVWGVILAVWIVGLVAAGSSQLDRRSLIAAPLIVGTLLLGVFASCAIGGQLRGAGMLVLALGMTYGVFYAGVLERREAARGAGEFAAAARVAERIEVDRPVVAQARCDLKFCYDVTRRIGRPLTRRPRQPGWSYWVTPSGGPAPGAGRRLVETPQYELWRVEQPEAWSQLSEPLYPQILDADVERRYLERLEQARAEHALAPDDADRWIWLGRRTAYLGHFREAVEIYTRGIERFPEDARFYRHRGHRYISLRRFDDAIRDLERAASLIEGRPDGIEPDGLPNAAGIPRTTLQSNIWYHLGLAYYVKGDLAGAERCFRRGLGVAPNDDNFVSTTHWLYLTLRRAGRNGEAARLLEPVRETMDVIENHGYHALLLMYRDERSPERVLADAGASTLQQATVGYGIGIWHLVNHRREEALAARDRVHATQQWPAFGFVAAEADLKRALDRAL